MSVVVASLSDGKDGIDLVRAYISIRVATRLTEPLADSDIEDAIEQLTAAESHLDTPDFDAILDLHKELAKLHWLRKHTAILKGKLAHKLDEYSYEGTIFALQRDSKQPVTLGQREKAKEVCGKMADLNREIEEHELKAWKEQDAEEYQRLKDELELRALQDEVDAHEDAEADTEVREITARLEQKLKRVLHRESPEPDATEASTEYEESDRELERYEEFVFSFSVLVGSKPPLIGDCALLPHPKADILYAMKFVVDVYRTKQEQTANPSLAANYQKLIDITNHLFTCLARDWQIIAPEDKAAISRLAGCDEFPDWALPLQRKYIDDDRGRDEACHAAFQVLTDKVSRENAEPEDTRTQISLPRVAFIILRLTAACFAFWATAKHPYAFYTVTRWVVFITCCWGVFWFVRRLWPSIAPAYAIVGLVFNPLFPFHFTRATWLVLDIAAGIILLATLPFRHPSPSYERSA